MSPAQLSPAVGMHAGSMLHARPYVRCKACAMCQPRQTCRSSAGVLEYSLSQTTLEQVFLEVAGQAQAQP